MVKKGLEREEENLVKEIHSDQMTMNNGIDTRYQPIEL